jgi:hypothetical protein
MNHLDSKDLGWVGALNLEQMIRKAFALKREQELLPILKCLQEPIRSKYREIWQQEMDKRERE